jgi:hypothetical protein
MTNEEIKKISKEVDAVGIAIIITMFMLFLIQILALDDTERRLTEQNKTIIKKLEKLQSKD